MEQDPFKGLSSSERWTSAATWDLDEAAQDALLADPDLRRALARNPYVCASAQRVLAYDEVLRVRDELANNHRVNAQVQLVLVRDRAPVRATLAENPSATAVIQQLLVLDPDQVVRACLATNEGLLEKLQHVLVGDKACLVRSALAANPTVLPRVARQLADDFDFTTREAVAENDAITLDSTFPLACLEGSARGREMVRAAMEGDRTDTLAVLRSGWTGTLEEMLETAGEFAPSAEEA